MRTIKTALTTLVLLCAAALAAKAQAGGSAWSEGLGASVRLVPGMAVSPTVWRAGVEFHLQPGWKTYWRVPGDSGVPPIFDWSKSTNLDQITVRWPAPVLFDDGGSTSIGYSSDVVLPLDVKPLDASKPVALKLTMDYAVCAKQCVPAQAVLDLSVDGAAPDAVDAALVSAHDKRVPLSIPLGGNGAVSFEAVTLDTSSKPQRLLISARGPKDAALLVEGPPTWFFPATTADVQPDGRLSFAVPLDGLPTNAVMAGTALTLTMTAGVSGIEAHFTLPN